MGLGLFGFVTFEQTAIETVPPGESVMVFLPLTPTPGSTPVPSSTSDWPPSFSWESRFAGLFRDRCSACHGFTTAGGLSMATYDLALEGGNSGPAIVPRDPEASMLVVIQKLGNHPGQLSPQELEEVMAWIESGAP